MRSALLGPPESEPSDADEALIPAGEFRALLDASSDGFYSTDATGHCRFINPAALRMLDYTADELIGRRMHDIVHHTRPDGTPFPYDECRLAGCLASSSPSLGGDGDVYWRSDGTAIPVDLQVRPVVVAGAVAGCVVKFVDLTERRQADAQLRGVLAASADGFVALDDNGIIVAWNPAAQQLLGWTARELIGRPFISTLLPDIMLTPQCQADLFEHLRCGDPGSTQVVPVTALRHDGRRTELEAKIGRIPWGAGSRYNIFLKDVAGIREAQAALARSEEMYGLLVSSSKDVICRTNAQSEILYMSPLVEDVLGWVPAELIGRKAVDLLHPEDLATMEDFTPTPGLHTFRSLHRDGHWVWLEWTVTYVPGDDGELREVLVCGRDITERLARQAAIQEDSRLESLGRLAAGLAHEINTPIQYVGDNARFLAGAVDDLLALVAAYREASQTTTAAEWSDRIEAVRATEVSMELDYLQQEVPGAVSQTLAGIDRVSTIVRAMKMFSHPGHADHVPADLNEALEATVTVARHQVNEVAEVVTDFGVIPPVVCDVAALNQVFLNLIVNAADAVEETGSRGRIAISTTVDGDDAVITISDSGGGIPEAIREKIFEPFFTTKKVGRGTGQGLPLVRSVVHDGHGGALDVATTIGAGTTFTLRLPIRGASATT